MLLVLSGCASAPESRTEAEVPSLDAVKILPLPPAAGTELKAADEAAYREGISLRSGLRGERAVADIEMRKTGPILRRFT